MLYPFLFVLLVAHCLGDFFFQTTKMATYKSKSNVALLHHVLVYSGVLFFAILIFVEAIAPLREYVPATKIFSYALLNGTLHFVVDFITSRLTSKYRDENRMVAFWRVIGVDQLAHYTCLFLTLPLLES
jgi:hypothetical protein